MRFSKNDEITLNESEKIKVLDLLGEGGQGEVYLVDKGGTKYALKVYKGEPTSDFRFNLKKNIEKGSPSDVFLWPKMLWTLTTERLGI